MTTKQKKRHTLPVDLPTDNTLPVSVINSELAASFPLGIYDSKHQAITLGDKIGGGGEGVVYHIQGNAELVAKVYHEPPSLEKAEKLIALSQLHNERLSKIAAWPVDVLRDRPEGNVIGFVMKKIGQAAEVHTLHSPKSRLKKFPEASWAFLLHVATNIVRAVATMHELGFVIGDVNPKNILVTRQATVCLLDCDSLQFSSAGKTYRCEGGFPEYTPPELQGIPFAQVDRTQEHDNFGLAIVIFQLLFLGRHPFSGRFLGEGEMPLERAIREFRFAYGKDATTRQMHPPPGTLPLETIPAEMIELFRRAFLQADRPNPDEWLAPLEQFSQSLQICQMHSGHHYSLALSECPWCEIEARAGVRLFNFKLNQQRNSSFSVADLWGEINQLGLFTKFPQTQKTVALPPSAFAQNYSLVRDLRYRFAIGFAAVAGVLIGLLAEMPVAFWIIFILSNFLRLFVKVGEGDSKKLESLLPKSLRAPNEEMLARVKALKLEAEKQLQQLHQKRWTTNQGEREYFDRLTSLKVKLNEYETIEQQRADKFRKVLSRSLNAARNEFLRQFTIKDSGLVSASLANWMQEKQIATAADLTEARLQNKGIVNEHQKKQLLNWRKELIARFNFNPSTHLKPEERIHFEKEFDAHRQQLEEEIITRSQELKALHLQVESRTQQLLPKWEELHQTVAQSKRDLEEIAKENRATPAIAVMVVAFFIVGILGKAVLPTPPQPPAAEQVSTITDADALEFHYKKGFEQYTQEEFWAARNSFTNAIALVEVSKWEDHFSSLFYFWGLSAREVHQLEVGLAEAKENLSFSPGDDKARVKLIILSAISKDYIAANQQYQIIKRKYPLVAESLQRELRIRSIDLENPANNKVD